MSSCFIAVSRGMGVALIAALALAVALLASPAAAQTPRVGEKFPDFEGLTHDGQKVALSDYKGKIVFIDFWATWCPPCLDEFPETQKIYGEFHEEGFEIVGISLDWSEKPLRDWQENSQTALPWLSIYDGGGWKGKLAQRFGIHSLPKTFLLDREGSVIATDLHGGRLYAEVQKAIRGGGKYLGALFKEWLQADAETRPKLETQMIDLTESFQSAANELAWRYLDEHRPARPSPKGAALCLKLLEPSIKMGAQDRFPASLQVAWNLDTAALAAREAGNAEQAAKLQTRAVDMVKALTRVAPERFAADPSAAELLTRQALYLAESGKKEEAATILDDIDRNQTSVSPIRRGKYYAMAAKLLERDKK